MIGYPFFFGEFIVSAINTQKKNLANILPSCPHAWSRTNIFVTNASILAWLMTTWGRGSQLQHGARTKVVLETRLRFLSHYMALFESGVYHKLDKCLIFKVLFVTTGLPKLFP